MPREAFGSDTKIFKKLQDNPLLATPDGDHYYKSIPAAMWPTLLNLSGEVPLADFTVPGRIVCGTAVWVRVTKG